MSEFLRAMGMTLVHTVSVMEPSDSGPKPKLNSTHLRTALILGGGVFGLTAAWELRNRGWNVTLLDQGAIPHPDAASTDINKVVRMDYASDLQYTEMGEAALEGWRTWNRRWQEEVYHEDGFLVMNSGPMRPGGFEHDSFELLSSRGHRLKKIDRDGLRCDYPEWNADRFGEGYFNRKGGWGASSRAVIHLKSEVLAAGATIVEGVPLSSPLKIEDRGIAKRATALDGRAWETDVVVMATGAWTPVLFPPLSQVMWATAQSVFHFKPADPMAYTAPRFPVWGADIGRTGWYGFPANDEGVVKVANHGPGRRVRADAPRVMPEGEEARFREFLKTTFPSLAEAPLAGSRVCLYGDTFDGHFWIDHDPARPGVVVAAGDSGHAFKFTPVLGGLIADVVERKPNPWAARFAWREPKSRDSEGARSSDF